MVTAMLFVMPAGMAQPVGPLAAEESSLLWHQSGRLEGGDAHIAGSGSQTDFGAAVAVGGDWAIVGAPYEGSVYVYEQVGATWLPSNVLEGPDGFGHTLAVDENTIVVGVPSESSVSVFESVGSGWELSSELTASGSVCLGSSLAIHGDLLAAGDPCGSHTVHVYERGQDAWVQDTELSVPEDGGFSESVDLAGERLIVGGDAMYGFHRTGDGWSDAEVVTGDAGPRVATNGPLAATLSDGSIALYERGPAGWTHITDLAPRDVSFFESFNSRFGWSLAFEGDILVAGASEATAGPGQAEADPSLPRQCVSGGGFGTCLPQTPGAAYVFEPTDAGWEQTAKLTPETSSGEKFASSVDVDAGTGTILAGAPGHPHTFTGFVDTRDAVHVFTQAPTGGLP
jgi:hypothetical protein